MSDGVTLSGYGYANKTGHFTTGKERAKYGVRYRSRDVITVRLDLTSRTLHFLLNDEDQGCAAANIPKGAYRLSCCMQFKEQRVVITRFWSSLGILGSVPMTESTKTDTVDADKMGKEHETADWDHDDIDGAAVVAVDAVAAAKERAKELYADYKEPVIDPDAPLFGDDYGVAAQSESEEDEVYVAAQSDDEDDDDDDAVVAELSNVDVRWLCG